MEFGHVVIPHVSDIWSTSCQSQDWSYICKLLAVRMLEFQSELKVSIFYLNSCVYVQTEMWTLFLFSYI